MIPFLIITVLISVPVSILWVKGIDYMIKNHPNYKGDDLFGEEDNS